MFSKAWGFGCCPHIGFCSWKTVDLQLWNPGLFFTQFLQYLKKEREEKQRYKQNGLYFMNGKTHRTYLCLSLQ